MFRKRGKITYLGLLITASLCSVYFLNKQDDAASYGNTETATSENNGVFPEPTSDVSFVCKDMLEQDENTLAVQLSDNTRAIDCVTVGCGGLF